MDEKELLETIERAAKEELTDLDLSERAIMSLPTEIGKLTKLKRLDLALNQLTSLPPEIGRLTNLEILTLKGNRLKSIPVQIGQLTRLEGLELVGNQITSIPAELGKLTNLRRLWLEDNPLESPPPEVVEQGTNAILAFLQAQLNERKKQWVSKLLVVGEGGVGKTSLLRALRGEEFIEGLETTHGIGVAKLQMAHPIETDVTMELNTWDFGGQQIYHATHQFFLTDRSLFVLVWDARHGWEGGKLYDWLDRIQAKAPDSPVMIVATHIDERDADVPSVDLRKKYSQIVGNYKVSNKTRKGIEEFKEKVAKTAGDLPLMGEEWPAGWLDAANEIRGIEKYYVSPNEFREVMKRHRIEGEAADVLVKWLHELGDILYFKEDDELNDLVILDPHWVVGAISRVLESEEVLEKKGIFTREHMDRLWSDVNKDIRKHLLRLMESFDLSYRTLENKEISLVVERLPLDPPDYSEMWNEIKRKEGCKEISIKYYMNSVPAGIPTWFIARSHRFTTHTHWRMGAIFTDSKERLHIGFVEANPHDHNLRLTVRGPAPQNFFAVLRDGLELTLQRFPGLEIKRTVPCPGHGNNICTHEFDLRQLQMAIERDKPVLEVQCPETMENVSIPEMLFGLHWKTQEAVMKWIDALSNQKADVKYEVITCADDLQEDYKVNNRGKICG